MKFKKLPQETYKNMGKADLYSVMPYRPSEFRDDCKAYIKALEAGRLIFVEVDSSDRFVDMLIKSYEGTKNKGHYRDYISMLITLGFDDVDGIDDYLRLPKEEKADAILTRIYELGLINEKKYIKLRDRLY